MAVDPRKFIVADCVGGKKVQANDAAKRREFLNGLSKIGGVEGLGQVGEGLRTLTHVSNAIRTGQSVVPGKEGTDLFNSTLARVTRTGLDNVDQGATAVLDATGIGASALNAAASLNPNVVNIGMGQAKAIFQSVKQGNFELTDIPDVFQDLQNLEILTRGIFTPKQRNDKRVIEMCEASPYAMDLIRYAPKQKFLFVVQIILTPGVANNANFKDAADRLSFVVKTSNRPQVEFEYEEVNQYNFRTRIPKRTIYHPISMTFIDDELNNATNFYDLYLTELSPLYSSAGKLQADADTLAKYSMGEFDQVQPQDAAIDQTTGQALDRIRYTGSYTPYGVDEHRKTVIQEIRLFHVFNYGKNMTMYRFHNPKITSFEPSELTMSDSGSGSELALQFHYDALSVLPAIDVATTDEYRLSQLSGEAINATYPINPIFDSTSSTSAGGGGINALSSAAVNASSGVIRNLI